MSDPEEFTLWLKHSLKDIVSAYNDVKQLYGLTESEVIVMSQMLQAVTQLGLSPELTVRLLKALSTLMEMIVEKQAKTK